MQHDQGSTEPLKMGGFPPVRSPIQGSSPRQHLIQQGHLASKIFQAEALPKGLTKTIYQVEAK